MPLTLSFDQRDNFLLGGVNYGMVSVVNGDIRSVTGKQNFTRWNLDVARQQRLSDRVSLYGHLQAQKANANLDSSEGLSLGGATGVRAYPSGESSGDEGWLMQFELRASFDAVSPYVFYDQGKIRVDANPELVDSPAPDQQRAGAGLGIRYQQGGWNVDAALAWRTKGGAPQADKGIDPKPRMWVQARYAF
jgi:hemolysin activation/secretion protein